MSTVVIFREMVFSSARKEWGCDCCCALQEKSKQEGGKQGKGCDRNSIERSLQVATCQQVEVHEVLLTEDASTFSSSINRGRLDNQVNTQSK